MFDENSTVYKESNYRTRRWSQSIKKEEKII